MSLYLKTEAAKILVDAAKALAQPKLAEAAVRDLQELNLEKPNDSMMVKPVLARYAESQGRKLDALLLYQSAFNARPTGVKPPKDELAENVDRLYKELGGTDATRNLWNIPGKKPAVATEDGRWETPKKPMLSWELSDLTGKTWKLKSLEGKTLLINVWATWCGPCRQELPYLERLYQRVKNRTDILVLSLNIDDEIGKVQPFLTEQKLTFPVLLGKNYVDELLPIISIPRNWIVDARGKWRAEQTGFGHDENWEDSMLQRLEQTKPENE